MFIDRDKLEVLSPGFSDRFERKYGTEGQGVSVHVSGEYGPSIEAALYGAVERNAKRAVELIEDEQREQEEQRKNERREQEEQRKAAREQNPQLTARIFDIEASPEMFAGKCLYLDQFWISGSSNRNGEDDFRLSVTDNRGKYYTSVSTSGKDIVFSTSRVIASQLDAHTEDGVKYSVKLYCDMYVRLSGGPTAVVYKIDLYNNAGRVLFTLKD